MNINSVSYRHILEFFREFERQVSALHAERGAINASEVARAAAALRARAAAAALRVELRKADIPTDRRETRVEKYLRWLPEARTRDEGRACEDLKFKLLRLYTVEMDRRAAAAATRSAPATPQLPAPSTHHYLLTITRSDGVEVTGEAAVTEYTSPEPAPLLLRAARALTDTSFPATSVHLIRKER